MMKTGSKWVSGYALGMVLLYFMGDSLSTRPGGRPGTQQKPLMAEDVFKNVQLLKGISVKEFLDTMGFFSAATGMNCIDCHSPEADASLDGYAIDTPLKQTARKMMLMVNMINQDQFRRTAQSYLLHLPSCHGPPGSHSKSAGPVQRRAG